MSGPIGYYLVKVNVAPGGDTPMPGAPVLHLTLGVNAPTGQVNGSAEITQALPPPYGKISIPQVTGQLLHTGFGTDTVLVHVGGEYVLSVPPPAIGSYLAKFSAALAVDADWNGKGTYSYGTHTLTDCTVTKQS